MIVLYCIVHVHSGVASFAQTLHVLRVLRARSSCDIALQTSFCGDVIAKAQIPRIMQFSFFIFIFSVLHFSVLHFHRPRKYTNTKFSTTTTH